MNAIPRLLLLVGLILWVALPGVSGDGGDNAGGTGIWILPQAGSLGTGVGGPPRAALAVPTLSQDITMKVSAECGHCTAVFVDSLSQVPVALTVTGTHIRIPAALLQSVSAAGCANANIVVTNAAHIGYAMQVIIDRGAGTAIIRVL